MTFKTYFNIISVAEILTRRHRRSHCDPINFMTVNDLLLPRAINSIDNVVEGIVATEQSRASLLVPLL